MPILYVILRLIWPMLGKIELFLEDEFPSMSLIAKLFESVGANRMVTLDIHSLMALSYFSIEVENISSIPLFADYVKTNMHLHEPLAVSPDFGGKERIEEILENFRS